MARAISGYRIYGALFLCVLSALLLNVMLKYVRFISLVAGVAIVPAIKAMRILKHDYHDKTSWSFHHN